MPGANLHQKALPEKFRICKPVIASSDFPMTLTAVVCEYAHPPKSFPATLVRKKRRAEQQHINAAPSYHTKWNHANIYTRKIQRAQPSKSR